MISRMTMKFVMLATFATVFLFSASAYAAKPGEVLTSPESGWQRYDDTDPNIYWSTTPTRFSPVPDWYNKTDTGSATIGTKIVFYFQGTQVRLIGGTYKNKSNNISVKIDGNPAGEFSQYSSTAIAQVLLFENKGLNSGIHMVEVTNNQSAWMELDAVDIDATGSLIGFQPTNLQASIDNSVVTLHWDSIPQASGYNVKRSTTAGGPYTTIASAVTSNFYKDTSAISGVTYYYVVCTVTFGCESSNSVEAKAALPQIPETPNELKASAGSASVKLNWSSVSNAIGYNLKRASASGGPYTTIATVTGTTYTDLSVSNGNTYYYVISAVNSDGESKNSKEVSATPAELVVHRVLLTLTLTTGLEKEYDLSLDEVNAFLDWYEKKSAGSGAALFIFNKHENNIGPFKSRKDYIVYDKILTFGINEYVPAR
ncbi:fibronectin type III domain-containing protein [Paenibacillus oleatilyticus]|uniref:fibronectin type III domain-containing protein n=1 Tax=Paenibacillus oleatilyticus TaxID=2594886 RepID=UPI001C1F22B1|nr:hypothetical protein [Paenibacillus oleatilyticus]MBU7314377.1 hypothetical protein [Paenibacillus oleatilyticus]